MTARDRQHPPTEPEVSPDRLAELVWGLFDRKQQAVFDRGSLPPNLLDEFVQCPEVQAATRDYLTQLRAIWARRNPERSLSLRHDEPTQVVERYEPPDFSPEPQAAEADLAPRPVEPGPMKNANDKTRAMSKPPGKPTSPGAEPSPQPTPAPPIESAAATQQAQTKQNPMIRPGQIPPTTAAPKPPPAPRVSFSLPNAKVGQDYAEVIEAQDPSGKVAKILDARIPDGLGLTFDPETRELRGIPLLDGDYRIPVRWTIDGSGTHSGDCLLIVNPDPRNLWKIIEPPADSPYPKEHLDSKLLETGAFRIAAASRRGRSHEHAGSFRDDDFCILHDADSGWSLLLVADGAGSAPFSREGSRIAVSTAGEHLLAALKGDVGAEVADALGGWEQEPNATGQTVGTRFYYLFREACMLAIAAIEHEARTRGAAPRDYATTFLAAAVKRQAGATFLVTFWVGDGAIAAYGPRGKVRLMGTPDGGEFAGQTRFLDRGTLADASSAKRLGIGRFEDLSAVLLMSDGVSDPRFETDNGLNDPDKWDKLWDEIAPMLEAPEPAERLAQWLEFFSPGHHDDRTIAVLW